MGYGPNAQGRGLEAWFRSKTVFEPYGFDYHLMHDDWNDWEDTSPEGLGECAERLGVMRGMIRDLSGEVAIVSHSSVVSAFGGINNCKSLHSAISQIWQGYANLRGQDRTSARDEPGISSYRLNTVGRLQPISEDELELHREQYDDINREYQDSTMGDNGSENSNANNSDLEEGSDDNQADDSDKSSVVSRLEVDRSESDLEDLDESSDDGDADKSGVDVDDSQSSVCTNEESDLETTAETEEMEVDENDGQCSVHPEEESCSEEFDENERMDGDADASQMSDCSDEESDSGEEVEMVKKSVRGRMTGLPERFFSISTSKSTYAASRRN